jgi:predicted metal-dependent hydrolase
VEGHHRIVNPQGESALVTLVINRRARRISLRIDPTRREATVTSPSKRACKEALQFAEERIPWILAQLARLPTPTVIEHNGVIPIRGAPHRLRHEAGRGGATYLEQPERALVVHAPDAKLFAGRVVRFLKAEATQALCESVDRHAVTLGVKPGRITVKDTRSRWGSCTSDGALAFSWRVILAPPSILDYLAAHEVAHLREMNHSPRFWALVNQCMPNYREARSWLRRHGVALHAVQPAKHSSPADEL